MTRKLDYLVFDADNANSIVGMRRMETLRRILGERAAWCHTIAHFGQGFVGRRRSPGVARPVRGRAEFSDRS